ncbi:hypothetical protein KP509_12G067100 [Ceratopteris richardii]|uniref:Uncharacterized protein n=1 Tax=Ceratopteris richardii TaxID=49495 RepID=A0A8T2TQG9_CERRI|nr:hypothetical protein KP509_12G067100 [Ceratopteris richardii]
MMEMHRPPSIKAREVSCEHYTKISQVFGECLKTTFTMGSVLQISWSCEQYDNSTRKTVQLGRPKLPPSTMKHQGILTVTRYGTFLMILCVD